MDKFKAFANYGVLAHEKQVIFTVSAPHAHCGVSEEIEITLPEGWGVSENNFGETLITSPNSETFMARDIISRRADKPCLSWFDGVNSHLITLNFDRRK